MKQHIYLLALAAFWSIAASAQNTTTRSSTNTPAKTKTTPAVKKESAAKEENKNEPGVVTSSNGKDVVAVYHFTISREYSYDYAVGSGNAVEAGLVRSTRFTVVERNRFGSMKEEDKFKEANTSEIVNVASRFGAKTIVTGHIVGVSRGSVVGSNGIPTLEKFCEISLSFKIIDVETGQIKVSETIRGKGYEGTEAGAIQQAYSAIDQLVRSQIGFYLPQRFAFMEILTKGQKKKFDYLDKFKIWGGSDHGLKPNDVVILFLVSSRTNPTTGKTIEEKKMVGTARILEVNSSETSTCQVVDAVRYKDALLLLAQSSPDQLSIEYKGHVYERPKTFWDRL